MKTVCGCWSSFSVVDVAGRDLRSTPAALDQMPECMPTAHAGQEKKAVKDIDAEPAL